MILLSEPGRNASFDVLAVFGVGLIGSAVVRWAEYLYGPLRRDELPLDWSDASRQIAQLAAIETRIAAAHDRDERAHAPRLLILWSAGRAGFAACVEETEAELATFRRVLGFIERLAENHPRANVIFGMTSSAGGLFEGQRAVRDDTLPSPRRLYGKLKFAQESALKLLAGRIDRRIYRLTSVFGSVESSRRRGLIPTLVLNGLQHRVTQITGSLTTLRDYTWVGDVASYVTLDLVGSAGYGPPRILASTKPSSIFELCRLVERVIGRSVYVNFQADRSNQEHITFDHTTTPAGWCPTSLETCVRRIYRDAQCNANALAAGIN